MTINRFIEIWIHRFHKIVDMATSFWYFLKTSFLILFYKITNPQKKLIGVILAEHFGDIVACEPLSREIKKIHPNSIVFWVVRKPFRELIDSNPNIDVTIVEYSVFHSMLLARYNGFSHLYNLHMPKLRIYPYTQTFLKNPYAETLGITVQNYFQFGNLIEVFAQIAQLPLLNETPKVYISSANKARVDTIRLPEKFIAIHCHSNYSPKDWQVYHWENLIGKLNEAGYQVVEVGLKSSINQNLVGYTNCCGKFSLLETAEIIRRAQFFIGVDSGPAHLANAVGTYGLLLFGKFVNFENYLPYSGGYKTDNATIISKKDSPCSGLSFDDVWTIVQQKI